MSGDERAASQFSLFPRETMLDASIDDDARLAALERRFYDRGNERQNLATLRNGGGGGGGGGSTRQPPRRVALDAAELDILPATTRADDWRNDEATAALAVGGLDGLFALGQQYAISVRFVAACRRDARWPLIVGSFPLVSRSLQRRAIAALAAAMARFVGGS